MTKEFFAYTRVSTVKQGDGVSLEAQKEAIENYAANHGLTIIQFFEEKETAAKQGRPLFTKMIKDLRKGKAAGIIMHKIDRSARNLRDWATVGDLQDEGFDVHFAAESVDFASRGGRLTADIQAVIAADYIRNLRDEIHKGQLGRLKQGLYPYNAPFGYENNGPGQAKSIDPIIGPKLREMFELYATGQYSLKSLETEMHRRGLRTSNGSKVYKSKIEIILSNSFYIGLVQSPGRSDVYQGKHEALIGPQLFAKVQEVKTYRARKKKTKHAFLFRGMFNCQACGKILTPERQRGHVYYRCHTKICDETCIREESLNEDVIATLKSMIIPTDRFKEFVAALGNWLDKFPKTATEKQPHMEQVKIDGKRERLNEGYLNGLFSEQEFRARKAKYSLEQQQASIEATNTQTREQMAQNAREFLEHMKSLASTYLLTNRGEKRQILEILFSNMTVLAKKAHFTRRNWVNEVPI